jgi:GAF domain-containing protein
VRICGFGWPRPVGGLVVGAVGVAAATGVVWALRPVVPVSALAGLYALAVLPVAVFWGVWASLVVAVVSALAYDFFFSPPLYALTPADPHIEAILVISAVTAVVVSVLAERVRRRAGEAESLAGEVRRFAEEQAALRRVATLVAHGAAPGEVFGSVATEVGGLFGADAAVVFRFEPERTATVVGGWSVSDMPFAAGARLRVEGVGATVTVLDTGRPVRTERSEGPAGSTSGCFAQFGAQWGVGAPISVEGRLWGAVAVGATEPERLPVGSEASLAGFTELVATAIANAQAQVERRGFAEEQAALRRVAMLVARAASPEEVFAAVAAEVRRVHAVDLTVMCRYDPDGLLTYVGWSQSGQEGPVGVRVPLGGRNVARLVFDTGRPARIDDYGEASGPAADVVRPLGLRAAVGVPVNVAGRLWGVMTVASTGEQPPPAGTEERLAGFTELVATAIANAQARVELRGFAEEQAALRRVATQIARAAPPEEVFGTVAAEAGRLLEVDFTILRRFEDGEQVSVGTWWSGTGVGEPFPVGTRLPLGGRNVVSLVFETGRAARIDDYGGASGPVADAARDWGLRSAVGVPISVEGRLWGSVAAAYMRDEPLPAGTEARLGGFAELVATAIANAQARLELRGFAEEQAALRRVATLVARGAAPEEVFAAVTAEAGRVLHVDYSSMIRLDPDGAMTWVGSWSDTDAAFPIALGTRAEVGGRNMPTVVFETGRPARIDYADASGAVADIAGAVGIRSSVGVPISVAGRLWGLLAAVTTQGEPLAADTEARLGGFAELVATAIANAQAGLELRGYAGEQAALRRVATLVARAAAPGEVFEAVTAEVGRLLEVDFTVLSRYEPDGAVTVVGAWGRVHVGRPRPIGLRLEVGGHNLHTLVSQTRRTARIEYAEAGGPPADVARDWGFRSAVGVPINVEDRLWGVVSVGSGSEEPLPADTEARLAGFTELVSTALANAEAQAALTASRARIVAAADTARRRIERDLHDGAQQRLVSLALHLRGTVQAAVPPEADELRAHLDEVGAEVIGTLDELRELARGIHPSVLAKGGLRPALNTLARRCAVPVDLRMRIDGRLPEQIEVAAYYMVSEALTNVAKHAHASTVHVEVDTAEGDTVLRVLVRDDGCGGADLSGGTGLVGLKDRVEALSGRLSVQTAPGAGTTVQVELPLQSSHVLPG